MKKALPVALALLFTFGLSAAPAHAVERPSTPLQEQIDEVLERFPGGEQIAPNAVAWQDGAVVLELADGSVSARAFAGCATGAYCAWSNANYGGQKLTFTGCSALGSKFSLAPLLMYGGAESAANARSSGTVTVINGTTVVYALSAGAGVASLATPPSYLRCFT